MSGVTLDELVEVSGRGTVSSAGVVLLPDLSPEERAREANWPWRYERERPRRFVACEEMEDAIAEGIAFKARRLRGTGELWALNALLNWLIDQHKLGGKR